MCLPDCLRVAPMCAVPMPLYSVCTCMPLPARGEVAVRLLCALVGRPHSREPRCACVDAAAAPLSRLPWPSIPADNPTARPQDRVETIVAHDVIGRVMLCCAREPALGDIISQIISFDGCEIYFKEWPGEERGIGRERERGRERGELLTHCAATSPPTAYSPPASHLRLLLRACVCTRACVYVVCARCCCCCLHARIELEGMAFKDVLLAFDNAVPIGIRRMPKASAGGRFGKPLVQLNPPDDTVLVRGDAVVVIAEDDDSYGPKRTGAKPDVSEIPDFFEGPPKKERVRELTAAAPGGNMHGWQLN